MDWYVVICVVLICFLFCITLNRNFVFNFSFQMMLFFLKGDERKTMHEEASTLVYLDAIFFLGMMIMAEGRQRKQEALDMLNDAYHITKGTCNLRATYSKVYLHLNKDGRKHVQFHGFHRTCVIHRSVISVSEAFVYGYKCMRNELGNAHKYRLGNKVFHAF